MCNTRPGRNLIHISSASNSSSADSSDMLLAVLFLIRAIEPQYWHEVRYNFVFEA